MGLSKVDRHRDICVELNELYERKNHDYGDSFGQTFREEGLAMSRIRLGDKLSRFKTLSRCDCSNDNQQQVTDESIRDTLMDLANYAIMTIIEMDECHHKSIKDTYTIKNGIAIKDIHGGYEDPLGSDYHYI